MILLIGGGGSIDNGRFLCCVRYLVRCIVLFVGVVSASGCLSIQKTDALKTRRQIIPFTVSNPYFFRVKFRKLMLLSDASVFLEAFVTVV